MWSSRIAEIGLARGKCAVRWGGQRVTGRMLPVSVPAPVPASPECWTAPLAALDVWLASLGQSTQRSRPALSIALGLDAAHFFRLPWTEALRDFRKAPQLAAAQFTMQFAASPATGSAAAAAPEAFAYWVEDAPPGAPRLACAVEQALLTGLDEMAKRRKTRIVSVAPWVVTALNRHASRLPANGWFAAMERDHLAVVTLSDGVAHEIAVAPWSRCEASGTSNWQVALKAVIGRTALRSGRAEELPLAVLDVSDTSVVSGMGDLSDVLLKHFVTPEHIALAQSVGASACALDELPARIVPDVAT